MSKKLNRNDPCHCGSGKKYKNCHMNQDNSAITSKAGMIGLGIAIILGLVFVFMQLRANDASQNCPDGTVWSEAHGHCH